jgi:hypothetical protein
MSIVAGSLSLAAILAVAALELTQGKRPYEVKSGTYQYSAMLSKTIAYFDDYGLKEARYTTTGGGTLGAGMEMPITHSLEITFADGTQYDIDLDQKTGTSVKIPPEAARTLGAVMSPALTKNAKIKDLPPIQILGKTCIGKETSMPSMKMVTRAWTWKGIPLRNEMSSAQGQGKPLVVEVSSLNVGPVPAEKFQVPARVKVEYASK